MSLRLKLVLWYTGVFALSGCVLTTSLYALITHKIRREIDRDLGEEYEEWRLITLDALDDPVALDRQIRLEIVTESQFPLTYRLRDVAGGRDLFFIIGEERAESRALLATAVPIEAVPPKAVFRHMWIGTPPSAYVVATGPLDRRLHPHLALQMTMWTDRLRRREAALRRYLFLILGAVVLVAALGGWFLASRSLKPIEDTVAELSGIESRSLGERLAVGEAGDELDRLRGAINGMLDRLEAAFNQLQSFTADAAHELRTPIAALQCRLEVALNTARGDDDYRDALDDGLQQAGELATLVDDLLFLARMDAEAGLPKAEDVDLQGLTAELSEPFGLLAEQCGIALGTQCPAGLTVWGDGHLLRRLLANLLDNALRHTPAGGRVGLAAEREGDGCHVTVADTGVGIEPEAVERIFDRFYRADSSRSREGGGAGLGLSIAKRIAELHGGRIDLESTQGEGTTVTVWLSLHAPVGSPIAS